MTTAAIAGREGRWTATLMRRGPWLTALLTAGALLAGSSRALELDREAIWLGEWWRVLSGHFVHYGSAHAVGDIVAFFCWGLVIEAVSRRLFAATVFVSCFVVGLGVVVFCPHVQHYAGLSAVDVALATVLLCVLLRSKRVAAVPYSRPLIGVFAAGHVLKTIYEFAVGSAILAPDLGAGVQLLPAAHLFGAVSGLLAFVLHLQWRWAEASPRRRYTD